MTASWSSRTDGIGSRLAPGFGSYLEAVETGLGCCLEAVDTGLGFDTYGALVEATGFYEVPAGLEPVRLPVMGALLAGSLYSSLFILPRAGTPPTRDEGFRLF